MTRMMGAMRRWAWPISFALACGSSGDGDGGSGESGGSESASTTNASSTSASSTTATSATTDDGADSTMGSTDTGIPPETGLLERFSRVDVTVPEGVEAGTSSWRIWGVGALNVAPVFTVPLAGCETMVGYTSSGAAGITARAVKIDGGGAVLEAFDLGAGRELRGLAAEGDGSFGALVWDPTGQRIWVERHAVDGTLAWSTELTNADNHPTDFGIGDSRLDVGGGNYRAYYHVHSDSGHEGDTLKTVSATDGVESTNWGWGCSHSMSEVLRWNDAIGDFMSGCVTDCYPGTNGDFATASIGGVYIDGGVSKIVDVDAGCNGSVAGELGSAAPYAGGWAVTFNGHQAMATLGQSSYDVTSMNQDVGFATVAGDRTPSAVVWLTTTASVNEDDTSIALWRPAGATADEFVIGWHEPGAETWWLARIDESGEMLEGPLDATANAAWGRRDDPFRTAQNGDVMWSWFDTPGSTTLHVGRIYAGNGACG